METKRVEKGFLKESSNDFEIELGEFDNLKNLPLHARTKNDPGL